MQDVAKGLRGHVPPERNEPLMPYFGPNWCKLHWTYEATEPVLLDRSCLGMTWDRTVFSLSQISLGPLVGTGIDLW